MQLTGAEIIIECLKEQKRRYCFWLSGRSDPECL